MKNLILICLFILMSINTQAQNPNLEIIKVMDQLKLIDKMNKGIATVDSSYDLSRQAIELILTANDLRKSGKLNEAEGLNYKAAKLISKSEEANTNGFKAYLDAKNALLVLYKTKLDEIQKNAK